MGAKKNKNGEEMSNLLICPICNNYANRQQTKYGQRNACVPCGLWSWGDKPLADAATHKARQEAHEAFDPIWKERFMSRGEAYAWLQGALQLGYEPHMASATKTEARLITEAAKIKLQQLRGTLKK